MIRLRLLAMIVFGMCSNMAIAQVFQYRRDTSIKVYAYGQQRSLAWCGGFNNPQFSMGDLNNDGLQDLVVFEPWNSVRTFINKGTEGNPNYVYAPEYALNFPAIYDYLILTDYNCDGIPDLFQQGQYGVAVYTGYYNAANQLCFTFYKNLFYSTSSGMANVFNNPGDIPAIIDVDNDGDLDVLSYDIGGYSICWYKNMQAELGLPCDSFQVELQERCWGKNGNSIVHPGELVSCGGGHTANALCLFDYDMDGDYDYLPGAMGYGNMYLLTNGRIPYNPSGPDSMVADTIWQPGDSLYLPQLPAAFNVDVNQDGKKDLLISPSLSNSENYKCIWYYKNLTTPGVPNWQFQSDTFLIDQTIDLGSSAYPILYDYNKDGKPDLLIGSDGYYQDSNGHLRSRISYYKNISTPGNPSFTLQTTDLLNIDSFNFQGAAPATGDIDNDSRDDLIIGHANGTLSYFKNVAASSAVQPVWQLAELVLTDVHGDTINVGGYAAPFIYDVDVDGKKDLIIGNVLGTVYYYQNVGTVPGAIMLKLVTTTLGNAVADPALSYGNYSVPFIGPVDSTGTDYLLLGSGSGNIYRFSGIASGDTTLTYTMLDAHYSFIDSTYNEYNHGGTSYGIYSGLRSTVTVGDIAGDGTLYMIVGNNKGGVELYKEGYVYPIYSGGVPSINTNETGKIATYPNPSNSLLTIQWSGITAQQVLISILNMEGQQLYSATAASAASHASIPVSLLPDGVYVCELRSGDSRYYSKFTVVR